MKLIPFIKKKRIYLDYAAATPLAPAVAKVMRSYERELFGNAGAIHEDGRAAKAAITAARQKIADTFFTQSQGVIFTSGGTEANNIAIGGVLERVQEGGTLWEEMEVITTLIEHPSITDTLAEYRKKGVKVHEVSVDENGLIDQKEFSALLSPKTVLITFAYANSEIGVVQDVKRISRLVRLYKKEQGRNTLFLHLDGSQAPLYLPCRMDSLGVDLLTLDAGKCHGPKGVGVLLIRGDVPLSPIIYGGGQEQGLRPGTEPTALLVGCAEALKLAQETYEKRKEKVAKIRDYGIALLQKEFPDVVINGSLTERIANNINISIPHVDGEYAVVSLDVEGVSASTRSACAGGKGGGSDVVRALGGSEDRAFGTIRLSLGEKTTKKDLIRVVAILKDHIQNVVRA